MPQPVQAPSMEIMEPFNIPTSVTAPVREPPHMNLTFPVFTPPAASSYGSTMPMAVPWKPPDLAGAIDAGLRTGAHLATSFMQNKKTAQEVNAEEQALKMATAAAADPARRAQMGFQFGAGGATATLPSALDYYTKQAELAKTRQETEEARARTGTIAPESAAKIAAEEAKTKETQVQTGLLGINEFQRRHNQITSGFTNQPPPDQSTPPTDQSTSVDYSQ